MNRQRVTAKLRDFWAIPENRQRMIDANRFGRRANSAKTAPPLPEPEVPNEYRRCKDEDLPNAVRIAMGLTGNPALKNALWRAAEKLEQSDSRARKEIFG